MTTLWDPSKGDVHFLDGVPIGKTTPSTGAFTSLKATSITSGGTSVTASTTHSIAGATPLSPLSLVNAANAGDAVKLPVSAPGMTYVVVSVGSTATLDIYPGVSTDTIDGGSAGSPVTLTALHRGATFYCAVAGNWVSSLFGAVAS